jgi:hypothetical protein
MEGVGTGGIEKYRAVGYGVKKRYYWIPNQAGNDKGNLGGAKPLLSLKGGKGRDTDEIWWWGKATRILTVVFSEGRTPSE